MKLRTNSLRFKMVINFLIVSLVPLTIVGQYMFYQFKTIMKENVSAQIAQVAEKQATSLNNEIAWHVNYLDKISRESMIILQDGENQVLTAPARDGAFYRTVFAGVDGQIILGQKGLIDENVWLEHIKHIVSEGQSGFSPVFLSPDTGNPAMLISQPVKNPDGTYDIVLTGFFNLQHLLQQVSLALGETGEAMLVDTNSGTLLSSSRQGKGESFVTKINPEVMEFLQREGKEPQEYLDTRGIKVFGTLLPIGSTNLGILIEQDSREALSKLNYLFNILVGLTVIIIAAVFAGALWLSGRIVKPVNPVLIGAHAMADGDFTIKIPVVGQDEIADIAKVFNETIDQLRNAILMVKDSAIALSTASQEISTSTEHMAMGSQSQAHQVQEIFRSVDQVAHAVDNMTRNLQTAVELIRKTINAAVSGEKSMQESVNGMNIIVQRIGDLKEKSAQIGDIIQVIDDIADQTNLLALNAAIEAARAGEQGRGFAVVAGEIRKLAERSGNATKQIAGILKNIKQGTGYTVEAVDNGSALNHKAMEAFGVIVQYVHQISSLVEEIASVATVQEQSTLQVSSSAEEVADISEKMAAAAQQNAASAQELSAMAQSLQLMVDKFRVS